MDLERQMARALEKDKADLILAQEEFAQKCKERLVAVMEKRLLTSFIGAVSRFEEYFGQLWGHRMPFGRLREDQKPWRKLWEECRNEILNNGNRQVRGAKSELMRHTVKLNKYEYGSAR